jgi:anti-repressor protein
MKELIAVGSHENRMTSVEIAELTGKSHRNVMRDIRTLIDQGAINELNFELVEYRDAKGEARPMYNLDYVGTMTLITGYDSVTRSKVVNRWFVLEQEQVANAHKLPTNYKEALVHLLAKVEENEKLTLQIVTDRPKTIFADAVAASHTSILIGELAKLINQNGIDIGQNRLFEWMRENGYLIKRLGTDRNMPTQKSMELELFEVKERTINDPNGSVRITKTVKVTGKGQLYFINKFIGGGSRKAA